MDEVEQIIEPTARIGRRPLVQLRLHPKYPQPGLDRGPATVRRYSPAISVPAVPRMLNHAGPLRHVAGFPDLGLLRVLRPTPAASAGDGPSRRPPAGCAGDGDRRDGSHVHSRTVRRGRRPAMPLQHRHGYAAGLHRGLPTGDTNRPRSSPPDQTARVRAATQPRSARFELVGLLRSVQPLVPHVRLSVLLAGPGPSGSAGPSRRCQGCFPPSPASPGSGCPQLHRTAATSQRRWPLTTARFKSASWRTVS